MSAYFDSNNCGQSFHHFLRDDEDHIQAFHADDTECKGAEFDFADMLNDEVERIVECPWCLKRPAESDHIKACVPATRSSRR